MSTEPILNYSDDFYRKEGFSKRLSLTKRWRSTLLPKKASTLPSRALRLQSPRYWLSYCWQNIVCPTSLPTCMVYWMLRDPCDMIECALWMCECLNSYLHIVMGLSLLLQILGKAPKPGHVFCAKRAEPAEQVLHNFLAHNLCIHFCEFDPIFNWFYWTDVFLFLWNRMISMKMQRRLINSWSLMHRRLLCLTAHSSHTGN